MKKKKTKRFGVVYLCTSAKSVKNQCKCRNKITTTTTTKCRKSFIKESIIWNTKEEEKNTHTKQILLKKEEEEKNLYKCKNIEQENLMREPETEFEE